MGFALKRGFYIKEDLFLTLTIFLSTFSIIYNIFCVLYHTLLRMVVPCVRHFTPNTLPSPHPHEHTLPTYCGRWPLLLLGPPCGGAPGCWLLLLSLEGRCCCEVLLFRGGRPKILNPIINDILKTEASKVKIIKTSQK